MVHKIFAMSDIHDDLDAFEVAIDYAQAQDANEIYILGDLSLFHFRPSHLQILFSDRIVTETIFGKEDYNINDLEAMLERESVRQFIAYRRQYTRNILNGFKDILDESQLGYKIIHGNHDGTNDMKAVFRENFVHDSSFKLGSAKCMGYGGADKNPWEIVLQQKLGEIGGYNEQVLIERMSQERPRIVLAHNPPHNFCDEAVSEDKERRHVGSKALEAYIKINSPKLVFCGHIHEAGPNYDKTNGVAEFVNPKNGDKTVIINPGNLGRFDLLSNPGMEDIFPMERLSNLNPNYAWDYGTFVEVNIEEDATPLKVIQYTVQPRSKGRRSISKVRKINEVTISQLWTPRGGIITPDEVNEEERKTMINSFLKRIKE